MDGGAPQDDLALQLTLYSRGNIQDLDRQKITRLAKHLGFPFDWSRNCAQAPPRPRRRCGRAGEPHASPKRLCCSIAMQRATIFILGKVREFAQQNGKSFESR